MSRVALIAALLALASPCLRAVEGNGCPEPDAEWCACRTRHAAHGKPNAKAPGKLGEPVCERALAQAHCPGDSVVWVNLRSKAVHLKGTKFYGHTKSGAYMCQRDATAGGMHATQGKKPSGSAAGH